MFHLLGYFKQPSLSSAARCRPCSHYLWRWQKIPSAVCDKCYATSSSEQCVIWPTPPSLEKPADSEDANGFSNQDCHILRESFLAWERIEWDDGFRQWSCALYFWWYKTWWVMPSNNKVRNYRTTQNPILTLTSWTFLYYRYSLGHSKFNSLL